MEMNVRDDQKLVEIWLTNAEKIDPVLREGLKEIYAKYKTKKYMVAVFESGKGDLYENTRDLLLYNRRRSAEKAVQQEKKQRQSAAQKNAPALLGISGMYAGSNFPLTPDQPVILGRDSAAAQIVFSQGAQKIRFFQQWHLCERKPSAGERSGEACAWNGNLSGRQQQHYEAAVSNKICQPNKEIEWIQSQRFNCSSKNEAFYNTSCFLS